MGWKQLFNIIQEQLLTLRGALQIKLCLQPLEELGRFRD